MVADHDVPPPSPTPASSPPPSPPPPSSPAAGTPGSAGPTDAPPAAWLARLLTPAYESRNWLKFLGVTMIISGVLSALSIVGLLFAWLPIWVGVLLWQAGDRADEAYLGRDPGRLEQYLAKIKSVATIAGITMIISLALSVAAFAMAMMLGVIGMLAEQF